MGVDSKIGCTEWEQSDAESCAEYDRFRDANSYIILSDDGFPTLSFSEQGDHDGFSVWDDWPEDRRLSNAVNYESWLRGFEELPNQPLGRGVE